MIRREYGIPMSDELQHHGILGQKWGKKNGPPYPLDEEDHSAAEKKAEAEKKRKHSEKSEGLKLTDGQKKAMIAGATIVATGLALYGAYELGAFDNINVSGVERLLGEDLKGVTEEVTEKVADTVQTVGDKIYESARMSGTYGDITMQLHGCESIGPKGEPLKNLTDIFGSDNAESVKDINPHMYISGPSKNNLGNCTNVAIAIMSRMKGYSETIAGYNTFNDYLGKEHPAGLFFGDIKRCFKNIPNENIIKDMPSEAVGSKIGLYKLLKDNKGYPVGSYGTINATMDMIDHKTGNISQYTHAFVWQLGENGNMTIADGVNGSNAYMYLSSLSKGTTIDILRCDNIELNETMAARYLNRRVSQ